MKKKISTFSITVGIFLFLTAVVVLAVSLFANSTNNRVTAHGREGILLTDDDETEWSEDVSESFNMEEIGHEEYVTMGTLNIRNSSPDTRNIFVSLDDTSPEDIVTAALFELEVIRTNDNNNVAYSGTLDVIGSVEFDTLDSLEEGYYEWKIKTTRVVEFNEDLDVDFTLIVEGRDFPTGPVLNVVTSDVRNGDLGTGKDKLLAQSFIPTISGQLTRLEFMSKILKESDPFGPPNKISILLGADPEGQNIGSTTIVELINPEDPICDGHHCWYTVDFSGEDINLISGNSYTVLFDAKNPFPSVVITVGVYKSYGTDHYPDGDIYVYDHWFENEDAVLKIYMIPE